MNHRCGRGNGHSPCPWSEGSETAQRLSTLPRDIEPTQISCEEPPRPVQCPAVRPNWVGTTRAELATRQSPVTAGGQPEPPVQPPPPADGICSCGSAGRFRPGLSHEAAPAVREGSPFVSAV